MFTFGPLSGGGEPSPSRDVLTLAHTNQEAFPDEVARVNEDEASLTPTPQPAPTYVPESHFVTAAPTPAPAVQAAADPTAVPVPEPAGIVIPTAPPAPPAAPTPAPTPPPVPGVYQGDLTSQLYGMFNQVRAANGIAAVSANGSLIGAAQYYSQYAWVNYDPYQLSHTYDGTPGDRAARYGYCCGVGEIMATAEGTAQTFIDLWMSSPPHRDIILDPAYVSIGVSCYGGPYTSPNGYQGYPILCVVDWGTG